MTERIAVSTSSMDSLVRDAGTVLRAGGIVLYPTDTVYGLGADATDLEAVAHIRQIKGRDAHKPIIALMDERDMLADYAVLTPLAERLIQAFLPGALTVVLETKGDALRAVASPDGSVGFRIPAHDLCRALVAAFGRPITSTSANRANLRQLSDPAAMLAQLGEQAPRVDLVLDAGVLPERLPSTIVDARGRTPVVLRTGAIDAGSIMHVAA